MPVFLECRRCTACCRWPGQVKLTEQEITRLAEFKARSEHDFVQEFTRLRSDRRGLALKEKANGECVFLDGSDCLVQPVKPQQCRDFPNHWNFPDAEVSRGAIPREVDERDWRRLIGKIAGRGISSQSRVL